MIAECRSCEARRIWWEKFNDNAVGTMFLVAIVLISVGITTAWDAMKAAKIVAEKDAEIAAAKKETELKRHDLLDLIAKYNKLRDFSNSQQETIDRWECEKPLSPTPLKEHAE